ncbi:MAG: glycosyltransferase family 2 protein [Chloroflexi bacterium]|nr:glycosyltransferase family 2 protein [Chloroflexota bacterium]
MIEVSVILPTYNRLPRLRRVLAGLENQTYASDRFEVVVVSDGSTDGSEAYLRKVKTPLQIRPFFQQNQGAAVARNRGVAEARADLILFIDDDVVPAPQLIAEHMRLHQMHSDDVVVIGPMLTPPDFGMDPWTRWMQDRLVEQYEAMSSGKWVPTARQFYTGNASLPRQLFWAHGGFDTSFLRAEDVELAYRLADKGVQFLFNPHAVGYHYEERSFDSWIAIPYAYGRNDVIMAQQKGQDWLLAALFREYQQRSVVVRGLTTLCLDRSRLSQVVTAGLKKFAEIGQRFHLNPIPRIACSCLFNLHHYQGIADELGSREQFMMRVNCGSA